MRRRTVIVAGATAAAAGVAGTPPASAFADDHRTVAERANARRPETIADTFVTRLEVTPGRTPFVIKDLVDVAPSAVLLGHGHSDHAENAVYLAGKTGATLYASEETCEVMRSDFERISKDPVVQNDPVARFPRDATLKLVPVTTAGSVPGTQILRLKILEPFAQVVAFRHLHSIATPYDSTYPRNALIPADGVLPVDPRDAALFPAGVPLRPSEPPVRGQMDLRTGGGAGGPVAIFYNITLRSGSNFSLAWQDTIGALREGKGSASDYLKPFAFDAATPRPATRQRRRSQLRHFDGYPYAETRSALT